MRRRTKAALCSLASKASVLKAVSRAQVIDIEMRSLQREPTASADSVTYVSLYDYCKRGRWKQSVAVTIVCDCSATLCPCSLSDYNDYTRGLYSLSSLYTVYTAYGQRGHSLIYNEKESTSCIMKFSEKLRLTSIIYKFNDRKEELEGDVD